MITTAGKTRVTGFHCRQLQKECYRALKSFMELTGATTEEALQTFIQHAAHTWQSPQGKERLTRMVQQWKEQRSTKEITLDSFDV
jgi:hypothetical protein